jgi:hypothetical protein
LDGEGAIMAAFPSHRIQYVVNEAVNHQVDGLADC